MSLKSVSEYKYVIGDPFHLKLPIYLQGGVGHVVQQLARLQSQRSGVQIP